MKGFLKKTLVFIMLISGVSFHITSVKANTLNELHDNEVSIEDDSYEAERLEQYESSESAFELNSEELHGFNVEELNEESEYETTNSKHNQQIDENKKLELLNELDTNSLNVDKAETSIEESITIQANKNLDVSTDLIDHKSDESVTKLMSIKNVNSEIELIRAIDESSQAVTIVLMEDIILSDTLIIPEGKEIILIDNGSNKVISSDSTLNTKSLIHIAEGAELKLTTSDINNPDLLTLDGVNTYSSTTVNADRIGMAVTVEGQFIMESGSIVNNNRLSSHGGTIVVNGLNSNFIMNGGIISNNTFSNQYGGVIYVTNGGNMTMNGGLIKENDTVLTGDLNNAIIYVEAMGNSNLTLNNGEIANNKSKSGTILIGEPVNPDFSSIATMTMNDGFIHSNHAIDHGGAIFIVGQAKGVINGGLIEDNSSTMGGGIAVYDLYHYAGMGQDFEQWQQYFPAALEINGGTIKSNHAYAQPQDIEDMGTGGGIYVASNNVVINKVKILDNSADNQGGGVYVGSIPYVLKMNNTVIYNNTAEILGGGVWLCPTGEIDINITNGGAIFDNKTLNDNSAGDDFVAVPQEDKKYYVTLSDTILGGGLIKWYQDGNVVSTTPELGNVLGKPDDTPRFTIENEDDLYENIVNYNGALSLKGILEKDAKLLALSQAKVIISGNHSLRGGGFGSNGGTIIGEKDDVWSLKVNKEWDNSIIPEEYESKDIIIRLKIGEYELDSVTLNKENNWTSIFYNLPNPSSLENVDISILEEGDEYLVDYSDIIVDSVEKTMTINLRNRAKETGSLKILKRLASTNEELSEKFSFSIKLDANLNGDFGDVTFTNGLGTFELSVNESILVEGLPVGIRYEVRELYDESRFDVESENSIGEISKGIIDIVFTNKLLEDLKVPLEPEKPIIPNPIDPKDPLDTYIPVSSNPMKIPQTSVIGNYWLSIVIGVTSLILFLLGFTKRKNIKYNK